PDTGRGETDAALDPAERDDRDRDGDERCGETVPDRWPRVRQRVRVGGQFARDGGEDEQEYERAEACADEYGPGDPDAVSAGPVPVPRAGGREHRGQSDEPVRVRQRGAALPV